MLTPGRFMFYLLLILSFAAVGLIAAPASPRNQSLQTTRPDNIDNTTFINANNILMFVTNHGSYGRDLADYFGNDYGTYFPFTTVDAISQGTDIRSPLYAGGLWIGGMVNGQVRVTVAEYASEYVPGPMVDDTAMVDRPEFKVYKLYSDSTGTNPNADWLNWPTDQGAPLDDSGHPELSDKQALWTVYNDADPVRHDVNSGGTLPLGIEVQQTVWDLGDPGFLANTVIVRYLIYNRGSNTINNCYVGIWLDPDLGGATDDLVGCDTSDNLFFCYNADNDDYQYGSTPPAIGAKILRGPLVPSPGDTAMFDRWAVFDYRNLEMETFSTYIGGTDPDNAAQSYNLMRGLDRDGNPSPNGSSYFYPGDPVNGTGDLDAGPADKKMIGGMGPFTFAPGDSQYVIFAIVVGQSSDRMSSISVLRSYAGYLRQPITAVNDDPTGMMPASFRLYQNYPNPFNPATTIGYDLPVRSTVLIDVFNVLGQRVSRLFEGIQSAGPHSVWWDGKDESGRESASGIYFYRARSGDLVQSRKMVLMK